MLKVEQTTPIRASIKGKVSTSIPLFFLLPHFYVEVLNFLGLRPRKSKNIMKNNKLLLLIGICMLFLVSAIPFSVFADVTWYGEANSGVSLGGGNGYTGYGSNVNNQLTNQTLTKCSIGSSLFTPIAFDLDDNNVLPDIITTPSNRIEAYTLDCEFINDIALGESVRAMPVIVNFDNDSLEEIVILLSGDVVIYEYDPDNELFVLIEEIDYSATVTDLDYITCPRSTEHTCIALNKGSNEVYLFDFDSDTVTELTNELPQPLFNLGSVTQGISTSRTLGNTRWREPVCLSGGSSTNYYSCHTLDVNGENESISTGDLGSASFAITNIYYNSVFYAKMGNSIRTFVNIDYEKNSAFDRYQTKIFDSAFVELASVQSHDGANQTSNWLVADYDKDGISDACYLVNVTPDTYFRCYDSGFNLAVDINVTGDIDISKSCVLADFNSSADTLGLACMEGIFYVNESDDGMFEYYDTAVISSGYRSGITVSTAVSGSPAYIYTDSTSGFIVRDSTATTSCGNDICEVFENSFSCPSDCAVNVSQTYDENEICTDNSECDSGYCLGGVCTLAPEGYSCTSDDQCTSGDCSNGECTKPAVDDALEGFFASMLGDDPATLNFIAIMIIVIIFALVSASLFYMTGSAGISVVIGGVASLLACLLLLVWGWLSGWIFLIGFLFLLGIGFILLMLRGSHTS